MTEFTNSKPCERTFRESLARGLLWTAVLLIIMGVFMLSPEAASFLFGVSAICSLGYVLLGQHGKLRFVAIVLAIFSLIASGILYWRWSEMMETVNRLRE